MAKYKSYLASKTFWALVVALVVAVYNAVAPIRHWPAIPAELFAVLGALGLWGIRSADSTLLLPGQKAPVLTPDNVVPTPTTPTPAPLPAPEAAPITGDPMNFKLLALLSGALSLGSSTPTAGQATALAAWADKTLPILRADVESLGSAFGMPGVIKLVSDTVTAANGLAGAFAGMDRAEVVAVVVRFVLQEFAPLVAQAWLAPILASGALENLIESVYRQLFPVAPVVDAPELPSGAEVTK